MPTFIFRFLTLIFVIAAPVSALSAAPSANSADSAYRARNYLLSAELYEQMLAGHPDAEAYYNLGNARWRLKDTAQAVCCYHRALRLSPSHEDARFNLVYCQQQLQDQFSAPSAMFFTVMLRRLVEVHSVSFWLAMGCLSFVVLLLGWAMWRHSASTLWMRVGMIVLLMGLFSTLATNAMAFWRHTIEDGDNKAVVMQTIPLYREPNPSSTILRQLHTGTTVQALHSQRDGWVQVELPDGHDGWVTGSQLLFVQAGKQEAASSAGL